MDSSKIENTNKKDPSKSINSTLLMLNEAKNKVNEKESSESVKKELNNANDGEPDKKK